MEKTSGTVDMTKGPIPGLLLRYSLPVFLNSLLNQLYVIVDTLIVSHYLGDEAVASVTNCINITYFVTAFVFGIGMGASVVIAQAFGAKDYQWMRRVEGTAIVGSLICLAFMLCAGWLISEPVLRMMQTPADVFEQSNLYLSICLCGVGGTFLYSLCCGIRQAAGDTRSPLYTMIFSCLLNVALDWILIGGFGMGVEGAAIATAFTEALSGLIMLVLLFRVRDEQRIVRSDLHLDLQAMRQILRMGVPGAIEGSASSFANAVIQGFVNSFGVSAMAAVGAFSTIDGFGFLPITAFCQASATFTGQNAGALQEERTRKGARIALTYLVIASALIGLIILVSWRGLIGWFIQSPEAFEYARQKVYWSCLFYPILGMTHCLAGILRGAGKPVLSMIAYLGSWGVIRVAVLAVLMPIYHDFSILCWIYPFTWTISTLFLLACYKWMPWFPKKEPTAPQAA